MGWKFSRIRSSVMGLPDGPETGVQNQQQLEHIRDEMGDCVAFFLPIHSPRPAFWHQLQTAQDIQALWYLRTDLMEFLSHCCGESQARSLLNQITALFRGHLPAAQFASARRKHLPPR